ncbi:hypothetical protein M9Y10_003374 [Tritrichomonas musculus]|uniref:Myb-like DNA-binding domain containing protein n=1 Tax=Tritrichomonas musculus TaxID=1915356 RepID=A0ABR2JPS5_9EUKA
MKSKMIPKSIVLPLLEQPDNADNTISNNAFLGVPESKLEDISNNDISKNCSSSPSSPDKKHPQRRKFSLEEDIQLSKIISIHGPRKWDKIALFLPGRTGRQCRDRFQNYLKPSLSNGPWTREEDKLLEQKVSEIGNHWNKIAMYFKGRSSNNVKNRYYTYVIKQMHSKYLNNIKDNNNMIDYQIESGNNYNYCINECNSTKYNNYNLENNVQKDHIQKSNNFNLLLNRKDGSENPLGKNNQTYSQSNEKRNIPNLEKTVFPPIYPPNDIFSSSLNKGLFNFL